MDGLLNLPVAVLIVAADPLVRDGLAAKLEDRPELSIVGRGGPADASLFAPQGPVVLWDLGSAPEPDLDPLLELTASGVTVVVLVGRPELTAAALQAGARGVLGRTVAAETLALGLLAAAGGLMVLDPELLPAAGILRPAGPGEPPEALTPRELEVLGLVADGLSNKEIAHRLGISEHTVKFHVNTIMSKLGARSRTEAAVMAARLGLIAI
ncbi:MAG: DNA-binding response regulator [Chloroflexota bacterium]